MPGSREGHLSGRDQPSPVPRPRPKQARERPQHKETIIIPTRYKEQYKQEESRKREKVRAQSQDRDRKSRSSREPQQAPNPQPRHGRGRGEHRDRGEQEYANFPQRNDLDRNGSDARPALQAAGPHPPSKGPYPPAVGHHPAEAVSEPATAEPRPVIEHGLNLMCPICENALDNPKLLPCLHRFCCDCLQNSLSESGIENGKGFLCPLCQQECVVPPRGVAALKDDILSLSLQEYHARRSAGEQIQTCQGCDTGRIAKRKCLECADWLCPECCNIHRKVKVTRDHALMSREEMRSGRYDDYIKDTMEPLYCARHKEPLRLYCTDAACQAPICTVCKSTAGHDSHVTIEVYDRGIEEAKVMQNLLEGLGKTLVATNTKINNYEQEENLTQHVEKHIHKVIDDRLAQLLESVSRQFQQYADQLHREVDNTVAKHKSEIARELQSSNSSVDTMVAAKDYTDALLEFARSEEIVYMGKDVRRCLERFQVVPDLAAPKWRQPRLEPASALSPDQVVNAFGRLTFEGEVVRSTLVKAFPASTPRDTKVCALCDVSVSSNNNIILVDRDNKMIKMFDIQGQLLSTLGENTLISPNRIIYIPNQNQLLIKDEKSIKILDQNGDFAGQFAAQLRQPMGIACSDQGEILVCDWSTLCVHIFNGSGEQQRQFLLTPLEAPGYLCTTRSGFIAITDWKQDRVSIFTPDGQLIRRFGEHGSGYMQLDHPFGVCSDGYGQILVADTWNNRVVLLTEDGHYLGVLLNKDDDLQFPQALAVTKQGLLVVVEQHGNVKLYQYMA